MSLLWFSSRWAVLSKHNQHRPLHEMLSPHPFVHPSCPFPASRSAPGFHLRQFVPGLWIWGMTQPGRAGGRFVPIRPIPRCVCRTDRGVGNKKERRRRENLTHLELSSLVPNPTPTPTATPATTTNIATASTHQKTIFRRPNILFSAGCCCFSPSKGLWPP